MSANPENDPEFNHAIPKPSPAAKDSGSLSCSWLLASLALLIALLLPATGAQGPPPGAPSAPTT